MAILRSSIICSVQDLDALQNIGLFLNDLSMYDSSRDLVLAGAQQGVELKLLMKQVSPRFFFSSRCTAHSGKFLQVKNTARRVIAHLKAIKT